MAKLSPLEIAKVAYNAGFRDTGLVTAVAVALAESDGDTAAQGYNGITDGCPRGSVDRGLWQINDCYHSEVTSACAGNPQCAAHAAYRISTNGTNFSPWSTYKNGAYRTHMQAARVAAAHAHEQHLPIVHKKQPWHVELRPWQPYNQFTMPAIAGYSELNRPNDCGPTCIAMCLWHWFNIYQSDDEVLSHETFPGYHGYTTDTQMVDYFAAQWGIQCYETVPQSRAQAVRQVWISLRKGHPIINLGTLVTGGLHIAHWTVTFGLTPTRVITADPAFGTRNVETYSQYLQRCHTAQVIPLKNRKV